MSGNQCRSSGDSLLQKPGGKIHRIKQKLVKDQSLAVLGQSQVIVSSELRLAQAQAQLVPILVGLMLVAGGDSRELCRNLVDGTSSIWARCAVPVPVAG